MDLHYMIEIEPEQKYTSREGECGKMNDTIREKTTVSIPLSETRETSADTGVNDTEKKSVFQMLLSFPMFTRKNLIVLCSLLLIGGAVFLNWKLFSNSGEEGNDGHVIDYTGKQTQFDANAGISLENDQENESYSSSSASSYFASATISRQRARDEAIDVFRTIMNSEDALEELKSEAAVGINKIAERIEQEANIESLICAKGFEECVAVLAENSANIIVKSTGLLPNELAQIQEVVCEQSGLPATSVKIIEKSSDS